MGGRRGGEAGKGKEREMNEGREGKEKRRRVPIRHLFFHFKPCA